MRNNPAYQIAFDPAARAGEDELIRQRNLIHEQELLRTVMDASPAVMLILNTERQILAVGRPMLDLLELKHEESLIGLRPGEALNCVNPSSDPRGCGAAEACNFCGAAQALQNAAQEGRGMEECRVVAMVNGEEHQYDFQVWSEPVTIRNELFLLMVLIDISHQKRRYALERIFFHDILNTAGGLRGIARLLSEKSSGEMNALAEAVTEAAEKLVHEIQAQKFLVAAENGELEVNFQPTHSVSMLKDARELLYLHEVAEDKTIRLADDQSEIWFESDPVLLGRVLANLLKNALEAAPKGGTVTMGSRVSETDVIFWVNNPGTMKKEVEMQIFQRSFSTRGAGRGLGTYSVKLLTEKYLKGEVEFKTSEQEGTTFQVSLPRRISN
jgi:signal transduction histidine kinase